MPRARCNMQHSTCNVKRAACGVTCGVLQLAGLEGGLLRLEESVDVDRTCDHAPCNAQRARCNAHRETRTVQHATCNVTHAQRVAHKVQCTALCNMCNTRLLAGLIELFKSRDGIWYADMGVSRPKWYPISSVAAAGNGRENRRVREGSTSQAVAFEVGAPCGCR